MNFIQRVNKEIFVSSQSFKISFVRCIKLFFCLKLNKDIFKITLARPKETGTLGFQTIIVTVNDCYLLTKFQ